ncbi:MAG: serine hydrolase domain-containing protein [Sphingobacteriaceae bacterium]
MLNSDNLQNLLNQSIDQKKIFGTSFCIKYKNNIWCGASGDLKTDSLFFIASTTKLYITALILNLRSKDLLDLDDKIEKYFSKDIHTGLNNFNGTDHSKEITIKHLMAHTSGIPDYFQVKNNSGYRLENDITNGNDQYWSFENCIERSKTLKPQFKPGAANKAHYSDTNFQLLGKIIEIVSGKSLSTNLEEVIFKPLGTSHTYLYHTISDQTPKPFYFKNKTLLVPKAMCSFGADGGIVSTSQELLLFLEAFFKGKFFPSSYLNELYQWNSIFFPMRSGIGVHLFKLPWLFNPFGTIPALIGHSGLSGTLAYAAPEKDLYIAGTVNQVAYPDSSFRLAIKLIQSSLKN